MPQGTNETYRVRSSILKAKDLLAEGTTIIRGTAVGLPQIVVNYRYGSGALFRVLHAAQLPVLADSGRLRPVTTDEKIRDVETARTAKFRESPPNN